METTQRTEESPHLTVAELAARWHTTENAIYHLRHRRKLPPAISGGRKLLWPRTAIEEYEAGEIATDPQSPLNDPVDAPVERKRGQRRVRRTAA
ncbi:helix-turn-helix domain-containing protein [Streptomyces iconiensis]|uniref:Helix-turn-helix domain-containing protein n=1 Tax=Streptomyces iconiensis TaxID=1384038 RepID=A0ABT6ZTQ3_9ACTN|nr:helix-turn-helix domain-containing protein [Streptomyces iconiensis]MDJ1132434.1 helix-turn-helix domain-containing protein [Streptomyces iconiensis]